MAELAIDLHPDRAVLATLDAQGIADMRRIERLPVHDEAACVAQLLAAVQVLAERAPEPLQRVDVAVASGLLPERGAATDGRRIAASLARACGLPGTAHPRGICVTWAEAKWGVAKDLETFALFSLGDTLDGGVVIERRPWLRPLDFAHLRVEPMGPLCPCGLRGCLQRYVSTEALDAWATVLQVPRNQPAQVGRDAGLHDELAWRAAAGERQVLVLLDEATRAIGIALAGLLQAFDVRTVVLMTQARAGAQALLPLLGAALSRHAGREVRVLPAQLGRDAALLGAGLVD
jgi:glucokinase